jgi:hypothetical protein
MTPKLVIQLVHMVCSFVYYAFIDKDNGIAKGILKDLHELQHDHK